MDDVGQIAALDKELQPSERSVDTEFPPLISRRQFTGLLLTALVRPGLAQTTNAAGRTLDFEMGGGFGGASAANLTAVLRSAAEALWQHCPHTRWETPGFFIYHNDPYPITLDDHRADGRIALGLTPKGNLWAQFAYQFAHEFGHALAGHSNDWRKCAIRGPRPNHWLEESLCETASLFALRAMGKSWQTAPPYPNWKSYAVHLTEYAQARLDKTALSLPAHQSFREWFRENEASMREKSTLREKNNVVALKLLPLFEATPSGWEAITCYNLAKSDPEKTLSAQFTDWRDHAPSAQQAFVGQLADIFGL